MQNWQQQPSKQLVSMLKWLFHELAALHGRGAAHGALSMRTVTRHPSAGWALAAAPDTPGATKAADAKALARLTAFLCMSSEQRREYQPHHLPTLSDADLRGALQHAPVVQLLVAGLLEGNVTPGDALGYHFWHPLAVHAQVRTPSHPLSRRRSQLSAYAHEYCERHGARQWRQGRAALCAGAAGHQGGDALDAPRQRGL